MVHFKNRGPIKRTKPVCAAVETRAEDYDLTDAFFDHISKNVVDEPRTGDRRSARAGESAVRVPVYQFSYGRHFRKPYCYSQGRTDEMHRQRVDEHPALWRADRFACPEEGHVLRGLAHLMRFHIRRIGYKTRDSVRYQGWRFES